MPSAGAVSHRQKVRRSAINTGFSLDPPPAFMGWGLYSVSVFQLRQLVSEASAATMARGLLVCGRWL